MFFFDMFRKNNGKLDVTVNKYYVGNGVFHYEYDDFVAGVSEKNSIHLTIKGDLESDLDNLGDLKLYVCNVNYGDDSFCVDDLYGFEDLIIGLDVYKMCHDSKYTEFVFSRVLNIDRIKHLHDIEFDLVGGIKHGNYVGSVFESNGELSCKLDENIGALIESLPDTCAMHERYDEHVVQQKVIRL